MTQSALQHHTKMLSAYLSKANHFINPGIKTCYQTFNLPLV